MPKLWQRAKLIRSKNSGPFELTFDIIFKTRADYETARDAGIHHQRAMVRACLRAETGDGLGHQLRCR